jgi:hypothetical protein
MTAAAGHYRALLTALVLAACAAGTELRAGVTPPAPAGAQKFRIDWSPLEDYYSISGVTIFEGKERDAIGNFRQVRRLNFIAEARESFPYPPNFVARLCDADGIELQVVPLTFQPREFHWKKGERRRGKIYLPLKDGEIRLIKFVDMTEY